MGKKRTLRTWSNSTATRSLHLLRVAEASDAILLAVRAAAPMLVELPLNPPLRAKARFGLVTLSGRAQSVFLPEVRQLMARVFVS